MIRTRKNIGFRNVAKRDLRKIKVEINKKNELTTKKYLKKLVL